MTDCKEIFDYHMRVQKSIGEKLSSIENSSDLYELYFLLSENGVKNMTKLFHETFNRVEKAHKNSVELNIWDYLKVKKLYQA